MIEAASRNKKVFTLDTSFGHELLDGYSGVQFLSNDPKVWAKELEKYYSADIKNNRISDGKMLWNVKYNSIVNLLLK